MTYGKNKYKSLSVKSTLVYVFRLIINNNLKF